MAEASIPWTTEEIGAIVEDYLDMLQIELKGRNYNKAERNRALRKKIDRSKASIEYKHRNISAVMERLGLPFILGYLPAKNYQASLYREVDRWLERGGLAQTIANQISDVVVPVEGLVYSEVPERHAEKTPSDRVVRRIIQSYDPAKRDFMARRLGEAGERFLYHAEKNRLSAEGRDDLAERVRWISKEEGDGFGYDILSYSREGAKRLLEVKTTNGPATAPFWLSRNELNVSVENPETYRIARLYHFSRLPQAFRLKPPMSDHVHLRVSEYFATFR